LGHSASVRLDGEDAEGGWIDGRVTEIARLDTAAPGFRLRIEMPRRAGDRAGSFGRARLASASRDALTAPADAIVRRGQLTLAFVAGADGIARLRAVRVGDTQDDRIEILAGLTAGERVIVAPPATLTDGARLAVASAPAPEERP
jgi:hypothetical protein